MFSSRIRKVLLLGVPTLAGAAVIAAAVPAMAATCTGTNCVSSPVTVTATVGSTISLTGISPAIQFGNVVPGQTVTAQPDPAESYTVATNDPNGFMLQIAGADTILTSGANSIPNSALAVGVNGGSPASLSSLSSSSPFLIFSNSAAASKNFTETWQLTAPSITPPGSYSGTITYQAIAK